MNRTRYTVTPNPHDHAPSARFIVKRGETLIGYAPTRYKARKLAGDDAQARKVQGEWVAAKLDEAIERRRAALAERTRLKGWLIDGRPER